MKFSANRTKEGLGEVQSLMKWSVSIPVPPASVGEFPEDLEIRVNTAETPQEEVTTMKVELQGHVINGSSKVVKNGELTWKFVDGTDSKAIAYFTKWVSKRWSGDGKDTQGKSELTKDIKAEVRMALMNQADEETTVYTLVGAQPKVERKTEFGQNNDPFNPAITWDYDDFHMKAGDVTW